MNDSPPRRIPEFIDPVEDELIRQAASDCLAELRKINSSGAITRFVFSGNDSLRIRVSKVTRPIVKTVPLPDTIEGVTELIDEVTK